MSDYPISSESRKFHIAIERNVSSRKSTIANIQIAVFHFMNISYIVNKSAWAYAIERGGNRYACHFDLVFILVVFFGLTSVLFPVLWCSFLFPALDPIRMLALVPALVPYCLSRPFSHFPPCLLSLFPPLTLYIIPVMHLFQFLIPPLSLVLVLSFFLVLVLAFVPALVLPA